MNPLQSPSRRILPAALAAGCAFAALPAIAQETPIKFQPDWRFEGPGAMLLVPLAKNYFQDEKLNLTVDAGNGSGGAVTRVASGPRDMGFADLAALMELHANNLTLASSRQGQRHRQRDLDRDGPCPARNHAGARCCRCDHRVLVHLTAEH